MTKELKKIARTSAIGMIAFVMLGLAVFAPGVEASTVIWTPPYIGTAFYGAPASTLWGTAVNTVSVSPICNPSSGVVNMELYSAAKGQQNNIWSYASLTGTAGDKIGFPWQSYYAPSTGTKYVTFNWNVHCFVGVSNDGGSSPSAVYATVDLSVYGNAYDKFDRRYLLTTPQQSTAYHLDAHGHDVGTFGYVVDGNVQITFSAWFVKGHTYYFETKAVGYTYARGNHVLDSVYNTAYLNMDINDGYFAQVTYVQILD